MKILQVLMIFVMLILQMFYREDKLLIVWPTAYQDWLFWYYRQLMESDTEVLYTWEGLHSYSREIIRRRR